MTKPETKAIQFMNEKMWEAAVAEWRRLVNAYPFERKYQRSLGQTLYSMGEQRFFIEDNLVVGAPALFESIRYNAPAWYESRYKDPARASAGISLERQGGIRSFIKIAHNEQDYYGAGMAFMVEQWTPLIAGVPRNQLDDREKQLKTSLNDKPTDHLLMLELAAVFLLSGRLQQATGQFVAVKRSDKKLPIAINVDAFIQFCTLISPDASTWQKVTVTAADDWRQAGFSAWEAMVWSNYFPDVSFALQWWQKGFSAAESGLWWSIGVEIGDVAAWRQNKTPIKQIPEWRKANVSPEDAALWRRSGTSPDKVAEWVAAGFSVRDVLKLQNNIWKKFNLQETLTWREQGIVNISDIFEWFRKGIVDPEEAGRRLRDNQTPDTVKDKLPNEVLETWKAAGFDRTNTAFWLPLGIEPAEAQQWRIRGFTPDEAGVWAKNRIKPEVAQRWRHTGLSPHLILAYDNDGITPSLYKHFKDAQERQAWRAQSIPWDKALAFKRIQIGPAKAKEWLKTGYDVLDVKYLEQNNITPQRLKIWKAQGFENPQEIINWRRFGLTVDKAAAWRNIGCNEPYMASRMLEAGLEPAEAQLWIACAVPLTTAAYYVKVGLDAKTGSSLRKSTPQADRIVRAIAYARITNLNDWLIAGFSLSREIIHWAKASWSPEDAYPWWKYFCRPKTAVRLKNQGEQPEDLLPWHRGQPDWQQKIPAILQRSDEKETIISAWMNDYYREASEFETLEEAVPWITAWCFDGYLAGAWKREGYDIETARRWTAVEYANPKWVTKAKLEGITLESLEKNK